VTAILFLAGQQGVTVQFLLNGEPYGEAEVNDLGSASHAYAGLNPGVYEVGVQWGNDQRRTKKLTVKAKKEEKSAAASVDVHLAWRNWRLYLAVSVANHEGALIPNYQLTVQVGTRNMHVQTGATGVTAIEIVDFDGVEYINVVAGHTRETMRSIKIDRPDFRRPRRFTAENVRGD